ncbi:HIR complex subunit [Coemansia nantahalensis]|uniref:HIR complex subunit n=1 Tax=Coemansia nantahalensis TaxID=2789366 RepID=A0ACC1K514_9FUNG|nr:HIR complex subunit [Coemansia nantahalensis]
MRISKPEWLHHDADKKKLTAIFSLDFDPSGRRLATAGMDNKVRLWSTRAITGAESEPRLLSTLSAHSGAVMCVRFSHGAGRYLASGADDMVVLIWERDTGEAVGGNIAGAGNVETWRPVRRLTGHESDVCDVAWAPRNRFLATCGLDNNVFVWDGATFERVAKLTGHQQFVKGLTFDPAGKYLATQADDKTLRVWRTSDWQLQTVVSAPFQDNIFSTYFRRPSWAPDGDCIAAANAANGKVPVAALIAREKWTADLSFVGHHAAIEAVRFCPRVFRAPGAGPPETVSICAAGAQDRSVSVWLTSQPVPLVVAPNLFAANLLDLAWHVPEEEPPAGDADPVVALLAACSHDGSVALAEFRRSELGGPVPAAEQEDMLVRHGWIRSAHVPGRKLAGLAYIYESDGEGAGGSGGLAAQGPQPMAESVAQLRLEEEQKEEGRRGAELPVPRDARIAQIVDALAQPLAQPLAAVDPAPQPQPEAMPVPVRTENGRRRVAPLFVRPLGGHTPASPVPAAEAVPQTGPRAAEGPAANAVASERHAVVAPARIEAQILGTQHMHSGGATDDGEAAGAQIVLGPQTLVHAQSISAARVHLAVPAVVAQLAAKADRRGFVAHNPRKAGQAARLVCGRAGAAPTWTRQLPRAAVMLAAGPRTVAVCLQDGSLHWFDAESGARRAVPLVGEALPAHLVCRARFCLLLDCVGQLSVWDTDALRAVITRVSIAPLLYSAQLPGAGASDDETGERSPKRPRAEDDARTLPAPPRRAAPALAAVDVSDAGAAIVRLADGRAFAYSPDLATWGCIGDAGAYAQSDFCVRASAAPPADSRALELIQAACARDAGPAAGRGAVRREPADVRRAATLDHLEHQLLAADAIGSGPDVLRFAELLARHLAQCGDAPRATHWLLELLGPPLVRGLSPPADAAADWRPAMAGVPKRRLLQRVLPILSANRHLQSLVAEYSRALDTLLADPL